MDPEHQKDIVTAALEAVLLFYSDSPWDTHKTDIWLGLTGTTGVSTKVLCDTVRTAVQAHKDLLHLVKRYINLTRTSRVPGAEDDAPLFFATLYADALALVQRIEGEDAVP